MTFWSFFFTKYASPPTQKKECQLLWYDGCRSPYCLCTFSWVSVLGQGGRTWALILKDLHPSGGWRCDVYSVWQMWRDGISLETDTEEVQDYYQRADASRFSRFQSVGCTVVALRVRLRLCARGNVKSCFTQYHYHHHHHHREQATTQGISAESSWRLGVLDLCYKPTAHILLSPHRKRATAKETLLLSRPRC